MSRSKRARDDAHEGHAVAVARIHVGLNLEDEAGESRSRRDRPARRREGGRGRGGVVEKPSSSKLHAEIVGALPK
jgi:hypothetical protein